MFKYVELYYAFQFLDDSHEDDDRIDQKEFSKDGFEFFSVIGYDLEVDEEVSAFEYQRWAYVM